MFDLRTLLIAIVGLPLAATAVIALLGKPILGRRSHIPLVAALVLAFAASCHLLVRIHHAANLAEQDRSAAVQVEYRPTVDLWTWAGPVKVSLTADPLSAAMLTMVTLVSLLVVLFAASYMRDDPGYWRFFTYVGLFVFAMLALVTVNNFVMLYVFWEGVGLCSYLLIGFWYQKPSASAAAQKAFLVNRIGDFGFAIAVFVIWCTFGSFDFDSVLSGKTDGPFNLICLLLMLGACGKSAQLPLHVWLPDAMEGPTPVSALIHAATMVTAGVYMIVRCSPLFAVSPDAMFVVSAIGGLTALVAAIIALTQTDLKRILAYSTISQLGFMFLSAGAGSVAGLIAAMFHLLTHAFFKALLFLGSGSVMHATGGAIDLKEIGGLRRRLPVTHWTFLFGCLALAGVFPFAGFWSKDAILAALHEAGGRYAQWYESLYWLGMATAMLTAIYTFRAYFLTFFGPERIPAAANSHHGHDESHEPAGMALPLIVLAVGALLVGAILAQTGFIENLLEHAPPIQIAAKQLPAPSHESADAHTLVAVTSTVAALAGILVAAVCFLGRRIPAKILAGLFRAAGLYSLSYGKFFFDAIYNALVVMPLWILAEILAWLDHWLIDGLVDLCGRLPAALGAMVRPLHAGLLSVYVAAILWGLLALFGILIFWTG